MSLCPTPHINIEQMQQAANDMLPGLSIFARDTNLSHQVASVYQEGMIICEKAFVDATYRVQGMITTHRYVILSNHMKNLTAYEHGTNWGLCIANRDSHFKVLGTHHCNGRTAIILLHLLDDERWHLFEKIHLSIESDLVKKAISSFEAKIALPTIPELTGEEWLQRCSFPLGVDKNGIPWPL